MLIQIFIKTKFFNMVITEIMVIMNKDENRVFLIKFVGLLILISFFNIKDVLKALKKEL